jgi:isonocardicin synthase
MTDVAAQLRWLARERDAGNEIASLEATDGPSLVCMTETSPHSLAQYFLVRIGLCLWLGRKLVERTEKGRWTCNSTLRENTMLGPFEDFEVREDGVDFYFRRVAPATRADFFRQCVRSNHCRITFPFAGMVNDLAPANAWVPDDAMAARMAGEERHFQNHVAAMLSTHAPARARIYDPACSTGDFLATLQRRLPGCSFRGTDLSAPMIAFARHRHRSRPISFAVADAGVVTSCEAACDVLIVRFLNVEVVARSDAEGLFRHLSGCVAAGGLIVVFGHTPVLLPLSRLAIELDMEIISSSGATDEGSAIFACTILKRCPG